MFWLTFTREFYRLGDQPRSTAAMPERSPAPTLAPVKEAAPADMAEYLAALETRIKDLEADLTVSERARDAFLASMSHELRTPLNAIMGFSEMMKEGVFGPIENPTYAQYASDIHASGSHLLGKINDLLDIAAMDVGGTVLEEDQFALETLLAEVVEIHSHNAFARDQQLLIDCPAHVELHADRRKLLCALTHFVANALRHSPNGAAIRLMVRMQPDEGVILSVRDDGEGIAPNQLTVIREALQKDGAYRAIEAGGIGLGLSLSRELAVQHGGRVMIDSIRHRGTVVSMILPKERVLAGMPAKRRRSV